MSYCSSVDYLYGLRKHGIKLGLDKTTELLALAGNPHKQFRCIHVAGTNGKGSVSAMSASILRSFGFRVGLFTSPHLASFTERIRVDEREISESEVAELTEEISFHAGGTADGLSPTFFEFVTVMAFTYFARRGVEWAVIETGMGGRLDATNIIMPEVSVITAISHDHKEFLGETISEIAGEKTGIIKKRVPAVSALQDAEAAAVISQTAAEQSAPLSVCGRDFGLDIKSSGLHGNRFDYTDNSSDAVSIKDIFVPLAGEFQAMNASLAIKAVSLALKRAEERKSGSAGGDIQAIKAGLASTRLRGRLEIINSDPLVIIDGAHNVGAAEALAQVARKYLNDRKIILVLGIMADKDIKGVLDALLPISFETIFTAPAYARAESPRRLAALAESSGFANISVAATVTDAIATARDRQASCRDSIPPAILITGSFYTTGEALGAMGERTTLSTLRETL
jgi:dihydrofolate synthase/folylpolyglutamate synthase